jgi:hypothetical protein
MHLVHFDPTPAPELPSLGGLALGSISFRIRDPRRELGCCIAPIGTGRCGPHGRQQPLESSWPGCSGEPPPHQPWFHEHGNVRPSFHPARNFNID